MEKVNEDCQMIGSRLDKIRLIIQENPQQAQSIFNECPELYNRIQEIVSLLQELQVDIASSMADQPENE
jgi:hypothetical protein